jgi:8-oxo-dGTP pyrophosphatase MutT (NUDIX family)
MSYVFISYSSKNRDYAKQLVESLDKYNIPSWVDYRDIREGEQWRVAIERGITNCAALVIIMTPESKASEEVEIEITLAKKLKKILAPLLLDGECFYYLQTRNYVDVSGGKMPHEGVYKALHWYARREADKASVPLIDTAKDLVFANPIQKEATAAASKADLTVTKNQYEAIKKLIVEEFKHNVQISHKLQKLLREHQYDPDDLAQRFLPYIPLQIDMKQPYTVEDDLVINPSHALWKRMEKTGAVLKGDRNLFPVQFGNKVGSITYNVRRPYTEGGAINLGEHTLLDAIKKGDEHPFWGSVGLSGVPYLWGTAAIVYRKTDDGLEVLLGVKQFRTKSVTAVYAGQLTPPAGIVEFEDFDTSSSLSDALINGALRELFEETGLMLATANVEDVSTFIDVGRCKQQAFVMIELPAKAPRPDTVSPELTEIGFYNMSDPKAILKHEASPECIQALAVLASMGL